MTILGWVLTALVTMFLMKSAVGKIVGTEEMVGNFAYMKLEKYRVLTGIAEFLGVVLLVVPDTSLYGAILISCVMSAAVALHLSLMGGAKTYVPLLVGVASVLGHLLRTI